ncbi:sugar ABC transporter substrate-binding protein [Gracilibacillus alcaliphilus]|uniref:sugar ABC transporter substrate-binding protein n=1 Tax=Gracilibacillus alcaliphilus TaxID=1401441 RepID=UPI00195EC422|nr:sugar ABC transporter substrate-binding protein [Gracilibacillus alcaliphilus]MBM7677672.1 multiple sugar transport system substrate-binding protein [Gracilibacillus alcaliphilus]
MKKLGFMFVMLTIFLFVLAGCVGVNNSDTEEPESNEESADVNVEGETITWMTNDSSRPGWEDLEQQILDETGVEIDVVVTPTNPDDMVARMTTILSSGDTEVDIMHINDELITAFSRAGYLEPLENDVMTDDVMSNFAEQYMEDIPTYEGSIYSVPSYLEILAFWVNNELLSEAGMEAPTNKEEFLAYAHAVTDGDVYGYGGAWERSYVFNEIGTFINLFGGDYFDWENPKTQEALEFMYDLAHEEGVTPPSQLADIYDPMIQKFIDNKYGMLFMYTGAIPTFDEADSYGPDKLDIAPMPTFETNDAYMASWHHVINASSEKKPAAKKVLEYLASPEGQVAYYEMSGRLPARLDVLNDPEFSAPGLESVKEYIENSTLRGRPLVPQSMEFVSGIGSIFQQYISDDLTLEQTVEQAQAEIDRLAE